MPTSSHSTANYCMARPLREALFLPQLFILGKLPGRGLEPLRISPPDPKSGASANSATLAQAQSKYCCYACRWNTKERRNIAHPQQKIAALPKFPLFLNCQEHNNGKKEPNGGGVPKFIIEAIAHSADSLLPNLRAVGLIGEGHEAVTHDCWACIRLRFPAIRQRPYGTRARDGLLAQ